MRFAPLGSGGWVVAAVASGCALWPSAAAADGWLPAESPPGVAASTAVSGMSPDGSPAMAWATSGTPNEVEVAVRKPGGIYATQVVADAPSTTYTVEGMAIDDAGDLAVTWSTGGKVYLATEAAGASAFTERSGPAGMAFGSGSAFTVRVLPDGTVLAAGRLTGNLGATPETFVAPVSGGTFAQTILNSGGDAPAGPVAMAANGAQAALAYDALQNLGSGQYKNRVYLSRFSAGAFGQPTVVDPGTSLLQGTATILAAVNDMSIAADGSVDILSVGSYGNSNSTPGNSYLRAVYVTAQGSATSTPLATVSASSSYVGDQITSAAVSEQGAGGAAAYWTEQPGGSPIVSGHGAVRGAGPSTYGSGTPVGAPGATMSALGAAPTAGGASVLALVGPAEIDSFAATGGAFGASTARLTLTAGDQLAVNPGGPATVQSGSNSSSLAALEAVGGRAGAPALILFDGTPPRANLTVPATGIAGRAVPIAASAQDNIDSAPTATLTFGDGTSGPGSTTSHTYTTAGTYTVSLSANDASGNTSAAVTQQITISNPPRPGGGGSGGTGSGGGGSGGAGSTTKLTITRLRLSSPSKAHSTLSFTLSGPATVNALLERTTCVRKRHRRSCSTKTVRRFAKVIAKAGPGSMVIAVPRKLQSGTYGVRVTAQIAGNTTQPVTLRLHVKRA